MLLLASTSAARQAVLTAAGVPFKAVAARFDEETAKLALRANGLNARKLADALAELKAMQVSLRHPDTLVLGCDQTLALDDDTMLDKPGVGLADHLRVMSGRTHRLFSAIVAVESGMPVWRHVESATLTMRNLSEDFICDYVARAGDSLAGCVGGYQIEGVGVQLFARVEGNHFTIMGLPLLPLLDWLRVRGIMPS